MLDEKYIVEKSKALVWAQLQDYGAGELKILDTYLARINAREPESSRVTFTKKEYAELMNLDADIRTEQLKLYTKKLLGNVVTVDLPNKGYKQFPLFSYAECEPDERTGQITITIDCHEMLKPAFFDIARNGYVRYQLKNIITMKSQYSIRLYPKLKDRIHGWTVPVDQLRDIMGATNKAYDEFKIFKRACLKKALDEINELTDLEVEAENIKKGRTVVAIKFHIKEKAHLVLPMEDEPDQMTLDDFVEANYEEVYEVNDSLALAASVLPKDFTREQVQLLKSLANDHVPFTVTTFAEKDMWIADYLLEKTQLMKASPDVKSPFAWLRKAVAENW